MTKPLVSVLIDTYNQEKYIEQAVLSAVEQDFPAPDYEIVVVDDGSTDRTPETVRKFAPRVRLLRKKNGGQASAFNAAFSELRGEIVALLDGDDWFASGKLKATVGALEREPEAYGAGHGYYEFHEHSNESKKRVPDDKQFLSLSSPQAAAAAMKGWPFLLVGALTVRRRVLERTIPISHALRFCADGPIAWAAMAMGAVIFEEPLCYYRHHEGNLHAVKDQSVRQMRRRTAMNDLMFTNIEPLMYRLGVERDALRESLFNVWNHHNREMLEKFGGKRLRAFRTEMRVFDADHDQNARYRLLKLLATGAGTLVLPPQLFYRSRKWWHQNQGRIRELAAGRH